MSPCHTTSQPKGSAVGDPFDGLRTPDFMALVLYLVDLPKLSATKANKLVTIYRKSADTIREWTVRFDKAHTAPLAACKIQIVSIRILRGSFLQNSFATALYWFFAGVRCWVQAYLFANHDHFLRALGNHCHPACLKINPPTLEGNEASPLCPTAPFRLGHAACQDTSCHQGKRKDVESDSDDDNDDPLIISSNQTKPNEAKHVKIEPKEPRISVPKPDKAPKQPTKMAGSSSTRPQPTPANTSRNVATAKNPALQGQAPADEDVEEVRWGLCSFRTGPTSLHSRQLISYYPDLLKAAVNDLLEINPKVLHQLPPSCLNCILTLHKCDAAAYGSQCMQCEELNGSVGTCSFMRGELDIICRDLFPEVTKGNFYISSLTDELVHAYHQSLVATNMAISSTYAFEDRLRNSLVHLKEISDDLGVNGLKEQFTH
ncbi:hypothetical protein C8J57DRAFT_1223309 [Mycena rebaudengoi]|nr:hypothetical protein C8J57DRAFT_1223309 [Mycena rebaudengoi]